MDLLCFSHIRWNFVYQRPQHLMSRFARDNRVFIIEEPAETDKADYYSIVEDALQANLSIVTFYISGAESPEKRNIAIKKLLQSFMVSSDINRYIAWYYTPMALQYSDHLRPELIVYDCMDELSAFKSAPLNLRKFEGDLLNLSDLVFTGGHSLYQAKKHLHKNIYPFPSSIDKAHFSSARFYATDPQDQSGIPHPRFGFYGVIDERFDIPLINRLSELRPEWQFIFLGPITKINPETLPRKANIHFLGGKTYDDLPKYLSGWDVAMLPFALNESTKFISPTKTPEYLAAGKPVISTSIDDVVSPYGNLGLVHIADTAEEFVITGEKILVEKDTAAWKVRVDKYLEGISWNKTWHSMTALMKESMQNKIKATTQKKAIYV